MTLSPPELLLELAPTPLKKLAGARRSQAALRIRGGGHGAAMVAAAVLVLAGLPGVGHAGDTVSFSSSSAGETRSIDALGINFGEIRIAADTMGPALSEYATFFDMRASTGGLNADGTLTAAQMAVVDGQAAYVLSRGQDVSIFLGTTVGFANTPDATDPSYLDGMGGVNVEQWVKAMTAYKNYWESLGFEISGVSPFVEPDFWPGQGSSAQLAQVMQLIRNDPSWQGVELQGGSTLRVANAQTWYTPISGIADAGVTHLLDGPGEAGTLQTYDTFAQSVIASGNHFAAAELHSMAEAIVTANYNASQAGWWGSVQRARGRFSYAASPGGKRLGYEVDFATQTAAAVYRAPDGSHYAFAGGPERTGVNNSFHIKSTDRPMFVNGIGPITSFSMQADSDRNTDDFAAAYNAAHGTNYNQGFLLGAYPSEGSMAVIDYGAPTSTPALDGYRWLIQNVATGQYLSVDGNSLNDLANISTSASMGAAAQWDVKQFLHGYMELTNANSGRTLEVLNGSVNDFGNVVQFGPTRALGQQWYVDPVGDGTFYIKNANSTLVLDADLGNNNNVIQFTLNGGSNQKWRFVDANPTRAAKATYNFAGNANNSGTGGASLNGTISGTAAYVAGPTAGSQALNFDGTSTFVTLPNAVSDSNTTTPLLHPLSYSGLTVNTWVKWDGGGDWQRIFDFGTGTSDYLFLTPRSGDGTMRFAAAYAGHEQAVDIDSLAIGQWVNLSVTLGGNTAIIYVDGKPVAAGQMQFNPTLIDPTQSYIGKSQWPDPLFDGAMSQFSIYDYALTSTQIADLLNDNLVWTGSSGANWATNAGNFKLVSTGAAASYTEDATFAQLNDRVTFDGTAGSNVMLSGTLSPFAVNVTSASVTSFNGAGSIAGTTSLFKSGNGTLTVNTDNSYTGGTYLSGGTIIMGNANALGTGFIDVVTGGTLTTTGYNGNAPTINNTIYGDGGTVSAASGTTLTLAGALGGDGGLTLTNVGGSSMLRLTGNNSNFAGNAIIAGSNVRLGSADAGSGQATWTVNTSLQLDVAGTTSYSLGALAGNGTVGGRAANGAATTSTLNVGGAGLDTDFGGVITNNLTGGSNNIIALNKVGTGTQILSGANTYTGATTISEGILMLGNGGTTGSIALSSPVSLNGGVLGFNRSNNLTQGTHFQNALNGTGGLLQAGSGKVTLAGTNAYSGGTEITGGILSISNDASIGTVGSAIFLNGGTLQTTAAINNTHPITVDGIHGGTINITGDQFRFFDSNLLRGYGALTVTGNGTLSPSAGNLRLANSNTYHGAVVLEQGGILEYGENGAIGSNANNGLDTAAVWIRDQGELAVQGDHAVFMNSAVHVTGSTNSVLSFENGDQGNVTGGVVLDAGANLTVGLRDWYNYGNTRSGTISGVISGSGGLTVASGTGGGGTLTLSAFNTFAGGTTVNGGTLSLTAGGANGTIRGTLTINPGATVQLNAVDALGYLLSSSPVTLINVNGGALNNNVAGNNSASANWVLTGGTMSSTGGGAFHIGFNAANSITSNASATQSTISGNVVLRSGNTPTITVADGAAATDLLISGAISDNAFGEGAAGITKAGAGTLVLSGSNSYTGATTVNAGTLRVNGSTGASAVTVNGGGTLGGTGVIGGSVTVNSGGTVAPGLSPGILNANGNVGFNGDAALSIELGGTVKGQDRLAVSGTTTLSGSSKLQLAFLGETDSADLITSGTYTILSSGLLSGTFSSVTDLGVYDDGGGVTYSGTSVDLVLTKNLLAGDANLDGTTNGLDLNLLGGSWLGSGDWTGGDFNGDGVVNGLDLNILGGEWLAVASSGESSGGGGSGGVSAIPEPGTFVMLLSGIGVLLVFRRHRKDVRG